MRAALISEVPELRQIASPMTSGVEDTANTIVPYPGWHTALLRLQTVLSRRGAAILVGLPGVGKTAMLGLLAVDAAREANRRGRAAGPVLLDDAQDLSREVFDAALRTPGAVVLAGLHGLVERLGNQRRTVTIVELPPLQPDDYAALLGAMLQAAGEPLGLLPPEVAMPLGRHAGGRAGPLIALARLAVFLAHLEGVEAVQLRHVEEAAAVSTGVELPKADADPDPNDPPPDGASAHASRRHRWLGRLLLAVPAVAGLLVVLPRHSAMQRPPAAVAAPSAPAQPKTLPLVPEASPMLPLPNPMLHANIVVPANDPAALERGQQIAVTLRQAGYTVGQPAIGSPALPGGVRYFYVSDRLAASVLAAALGDATPVLAIGLNRVQPGRVRPGFADPPYPGSAEIGVAPSEAVPAPHTETYYNPRRVP